MDDQTELLPISLEEAIGEIDRELKVRKRVYAEWITAGKMKRDVGRKQYGRLLAARKFLLEYQKVQKP